jgi:RNA polymerase sigma-70 factor (ECF subfamily)
MADLSDEELVERYRAERGSPRGAATIDELFQRHHSRVAAWCFRITGEVDSAADLAQDVFLKAFQGLDSYRGGSRFTTWLYSIARNRCMDALRARAARPNETTGSDLETYVDDRQEGISSALERRESHELVRQLVRDYLDDTEAKVMTMHYVHELPLDSVTRLLGLTNQSGAKAYIVSARRKLGKALTKLQPRGADHGGDNRGV